MNPVDVAPVAVRVWTTRPRTKATKPPVVRKTRQRRYPHEVLVFDTETRDETGQSLLVGVSRLYRDDPDGQPARTCIEECLFYPDDLPLHDPAGWGLLQAYAATAVADTAAGFSPRVRLAPLSWWLEHRLHTYGYRHADRCRVVGFNLPFDLGTLARFWSPARGRFAGGWSLSFAGTRDETGGWKDQRGHPRLLLRSIDPRRTLFSWGWQSKTDQPEYGDLRGRFVDLRTATFALTDRSLTLEAACTLFGDPFEKADVTYGVITPELLDYARDDVGHTATLYRNVLAEIDQHPGVELIPERLYSPASVGTAILRGFGLQPALGKDGKFTDLDPRILGWSMSAFFGGRAEARIVRTPMPVVVLDATSMYSLVNGLLGTWPLLCAESLTVREVTDQVRELVADRGLLDRLFDPKTWSREIGVTLVQLDHPAGLRLPVRAAYQRQPPDGSEAEARGLQYGIGVNPLTYDGQPWYLLPDVLTAALDAPFDPATVTRAIRLDPVGVQDGLHPLFLRRQVLIDPARDNPFLAMINERHRVNHDQTIAEVERKRLDRFLKITASAASYGMLARFDRRDNADAEPVRVYGPAGKAFTTASRSPEDPGPYTFPPVAASITAGARLILTMIERCVADLGGCYVFMDTDSIAIVATPSGGPVRCRTTNGDNVTALSFDQVREVAARFASLSLYAEQVQTPELGRSIWKAEHDSLNQPLRCVAYAAKAYCLYRDQPGAQGVIEIVKCSEHGLGLYLDPRPPGQQRDPQGRRIWIRQAHEYILRRILELPAELPSWHTLPALTRFTISGPLYASWFRTPTESGPEPSRPRPGGFGLLAHPDALIPSLTGALPAAPYTDDPDQWLTQPWYDRRTGQPVTVTTVSPEDPDRLAADLADGAVRIRTLGDVLDSYARRPEHKSRAADGGPTGPTSRGLLRRRPLHSSPPLTALIGKEGHRLAERLSGAADDRPTEYARQERADWELVRSVLADLGASAVGAAVGVSARRARDWLTGRAVPHDGASGHYARARAQAVAHARQELDRTGLAAPDDDGAALYAHLTVSRDLPRFGTPVHDRCEDVEGPGW